MTWTAERRLRHLLRRRAAEPPVPPADQTALDWIALEIAHLPNFDSKERRLAKVIARELQRRAK